LSNTGYIHDWVCHLTNRPAPLYEDETAAHNEAEMRRKQAVFCAPCATALSKERLGKRSGVDAWHIVPK
jgi:hypothetical protein